MTKSDIIRSAFTVWGRSFYLNTSLSSLARELGVSKAALYRHFKNKQALLDAMHVSFLDDYSAFIRADYEKSLTMEDKLKGYFILMRSIMRYYACNPEAFIFSLVLAYKSQYGSLITEQLRQRNLDMGYYQMFLKAEASYPSLVQLVVAAVIFFMAQFHKEHYQKGQPPTEESIGNITSFIEVTMRTGLTFDKKNVEALNYEELENSIANIPVDPENDPLHRAVAAAVAEVGPWKVSMDMIAARSGLSKSGLYAHIKSKQDMLTRFFMKEFENIIKFAGVCAKKAKTSEERLYLTVISIATYLRTQPETLIALDWTRARQINFKKPASPRFNWILSNIKLNITGMVGANQAAVADQMSQWIFFLIVNTLMRRPDGMDFKDVPNSAFRLLYRFISIGLEGLNLWVK